MTPTTVGLVLVEGRGSDGATMDHDAFDVRSRRGAGSVSASAYVAEAVSRTRAIAGGQRLQSIGVTWSDEAHFEASLLMKQLSDSGFENIVPVELPEATEALARGIGEVIGSDRTAACVVEPGEIIALLTDATEGKVKTVVNRHIDDEVELIDWLSDVLGRHDWRPDGLVLVGSCGGLEAISRELEAVLAMPVFAPAEAELALARGAALATTDVEYVDDADFDFENFDDSDLVLLRPTPKPRPWPLSHPGPLGLMTAGVLTFVVSVSAAVGMQLTPERASSHPERRQVSNTAGPASTAPLRQAVSPPVAPPAVAEIPVPAELPPAPAGVEPVDALPTDPPPLEVPLETAALPDTGVPLPPLAATTPTVPEQEPSLRNRLLQRIAGMRQGDEVPLGDPAAGQPPTDVATELPALPPAG
jgi:hypothetical protein